MAIVFLLSFFCILYLDSRMNLVLKPYIDEEVERFTSNIISKVIREGNYSELSLTENQNGRVSYSALDIQKVKNEITQSVQDELFLLEDGDYDSYFFSNRLKNSRFHKIKNGILCDVSIGSLRGSTLFANIGPTIPIRLLFMEQVKSDIDVITKEYGINNIMVEVYLVFRVEEQITMPLTSKKKEIVIREPLMIDIFPGKVPDYYGGFSKSFSS